MSKTVFYPYIEHLPFLHTTLSRGFLSLDDESATEGEAFHARMHLRSGLQVLQAVFLTVNPILDAPEITLLERRPYLIGR